MSELESSFFLVQRHGPVVQLSMNRPQKANGMTPDFWTELPRLLGLLDADETVRAVVLTGEGKHFTGGMDLAAFASMAALFQQEPGRAAYTFRKKIMMNAVQAAMAKKETEFADLLSEGSLAI